ncbi:MAG: hypothetical protein IKR91_06185 [Alloprevotella sp.]|nr:hypothetical protein [Alloprevotella sp.]
MEERMIIVSQVKSSRSEFMIWQVSITGEEQPSAHCKSPYKAMRFMFLLKKQTGLYISGECLTQLSQEIARKKAEQAEKGKEIINEVTQEFIDTHNVDSVLANEPQKKGRRKPRSKKVVEMAAVPD